MRKRANILFLLAFVFSLTIIGCSKEEALTPVDGYQNNLRGGNSGNDDDTNDGDDDVITDPNDDEDSEVHSGKGKKGKSGISNFGNSDAFQGNPSTTGKR